VPFDPDTFHIRARCREDLDQLAKAAGTGEPVESYPGSDYPWRILCPTAGLPTYMQALSASIDYGNFKSAIASSSTQRSKLHAYHDIHHRMVEWQDRGSSRCKVSYSSPRSCLCPNGVHYSSSP
jgi:hypothetical protein